jgi:hypothetical protein
VTGRFVEAWCSRISLLKSIAICFKNSPIEGNRDGSYALYFMHYNFARIHKTFRVTPAMEAGVADHAWSLEEIAGLAT